MPTKTKTPTPAKKRPARRKSTPAPKPTSVVVRASVPRMSRASRVTSEATKYICSVSDPFCDHALGSKVMDFGSTRSFPLTARFRTTISTIGTGEASYLFSPTYAYIPYSAATTLAAGIATFTTAQTAANVPSLAESVRLVSFGIRLKSIVAPLSASGIVRIRGFAGDMGSVVTSGVDIATFNADYAVDVPVHSLKDTVIILRRYDPTAKLFIDPNLINPTNLPGAINPHGFGLVTVSVQGGAATTPILDVEVVSHWELLLGDSEPLAQAATAAPAYQPVISEAADVVSSTVRPVFIEGVRYASNAVMSAAVQALAMRLGAPRIPRLGN